MGFKNVRSLYGDNADKTSSASTTPKIVFNNVRSLVNEEFELKDGNNRSIGKVSYGAKKAIENNTLDSYTPKNDEEAETISKYRKQISIPLSIGVDGEKKNFGYVSYDAYQAVLNGTIENYSPTSESEKKSIENYKKFAEDYAKEQREPEGFWQGLLHGIGYTAEKLGAGAVTGVYDIGRFANAGVNKLLSIPAWGSAEDYFNETAKAALTHEGPGEKWDANIEGRYRVPDWYRENFGTVASNIGQLAIPIAAEIATAPAGGASPLLEAKLAQRAAMGATAKSTIGSVAKNLSTKLITPKASDVVFGLSAAGSSAKTGYRQSGDVNQALNYGILNGIGEVATEKLFGGIGGTPVGADDALVDLSKIKGISKLASNKYGKQVLDVAFEGVEEFIMAGADPVFQKATINPDANLGELYDNAGFGESVLQGILLSSLMKAGTFTVSKTIDTTNRIKAINSTNKLVDEINSTLPGEFKFTPLKRTSTVDEINKTHSEVQRVKGINLVNGASEAINAMVKRGESKLELLQYDSTIEEIEQRQNEIGFFATAYADLMVNELVENNPEKFADIGKITVGDFFIDNNSFNTIKVVGRSDESTTFEITRPSGKKEVKTLPNKTADTLTTDDRYTEVETSATKTVDNTTASPSTDSKTAPVSEEAVVGGKDVAEAEIGESDTEVASIVESINETLNVGALDAIYESMPPHLEKSLDTFAKSLIKLYKQHGSIGHIADYFTDNGAKIISAIESTTDLTDEQIQAKVKSATPKTSVETPTPQSATPGVQVGDVYKADDKTYTITGRENGRTTYSVTDKNGNTITRETSNVVADVNFTKEDAYTKVQDGNNDSVAQATKSEGETAKPKAKKESATEKSSTPELSNESSNESTDLPFGDDERFSLSSMGSAFFGNEDITADEFQEMLEDGSYKEHQGYRDYVKNCVNVYAQSHGIKKLSESNRAEIERQIEGIINVAIAAKKAGYDIYDDGTKRNVKDSKKRLLFSSLEPNSDYITSSDISAICDKRKNFAEIYDAIVKLEESRGVPADKRFFNNVDNYFILHKLMADKGLTIPCEECYVESMRKNLAPMAKSFIELVTETDPKNKSNASLYNDKGEIKKNNAKIRDKVIKLCSDADSVIKLDDITVEMLTTADGLAQLRLQAPLLYETFNSFYGQSKPKMPRAATPFRPGELIALLTDSKGKIKKNLVHLFSKYH